MDNPQENKSMKNTYDAKMIKEFENHFKNIKTPDLFI